MRKIEKPVMGKRIGEKNDSASVRLRTENGCFLSDIVR